MTLQATPAATLEAIPAPARHAASSCALIEPGCRWRFTVEEYERMLEVGILHEGDPVELIEGELILMPPMSARHAGTNNRLIALFTSRLAGRAIVGSQTPLRLGDASEPEPDLSLLRPRADYYAHSHPTTQDVLLLVEVSHTSLDFDLRVKAPLYARHGVPEFWVVNLGARQVERFTDPVEGMYTSVASYGGEEAIPCGAFPDMALRAADLLGETD